MMFTCLSPSIDIDDVFEGESSWLVHVDVCPLFRYVQRGLNY